MKRAVTVVAFALAVLLLSSAARADVADLPAPEPAPSILEWLFRAMSPTLPLPPPKHASVAESIRRSA